MLHSVAHSSSVQELGAGCVRTTMIDVHASQEASRGRSRILFTRNDREELLIRDLHTHPAEKGTARHIDIGKTCDQLAGQHLFFQILWKRECIPVLFKDGRTVRRPPLVVEINATRGKDLPTC